MNPALLALAISLTVVLLQSCEGIFSRKKLPLGKEFPFGMVEMYGDTLFAIHPGTQINTMIGPTGAAFPLYDGALLTIIKGDSSAMLYYKAGDGTKLNLKLGPGRLWINGDLHSITLDSSAATASWLHSYRPDSLKALRMVVLGDYLPESWYPRIFELTRINPTVSIFRENFGKTDRKDEILLEGLWKASLPEVFVGTDQQVGYADLRTVRALYLSKQDSLPAKGYLDALSALPPGGRIWLDGFSEAEAGKIVQTVSPDELALENTVVRELGTILWPGLKSLLLSGPVSDIGPVGQLKSLERLGIVVGEEGIRGMESIKGLHFLSITSDSATAFSLLRQNPGLQFVCLSLDTLRAFPALTGLGGLRGIVLPPLAVQDYRPLDVLDVPYVGVPVKDSVLQIIRSQLPGKMVYAQGRDFWGACLGSAWMVLLLPLVLLFVYGKKWAYAREHQG